MSDRVEERRQQEIHQQQKQQDLRTNKEKAAAAEKFKSAIAAGMQSKQQTQAQTGKKQGEAKQQQQGQAQNALMARQGINRAAVENLLKKQDDAGKTADKELVDSRDKDLKSESDQRDVDTATSREEGRSELAQGREAPVQRREDDQQQQGHGKNEGQGQGQGQGQQGQSNSGDGKQQDRSSDGGSVGGVSGTKKTGKTAGAMAAQGSSDAGKVVIGKSDKAAAKERIPPQVLQAVVDSIHSHSQHGMNDFMVQLKDDMLGGGSVRVSMQGGKMKVVFTMKDPTSKNLLESSKGKLMRMFEMKGLALESLEVKLRGQ